MTAGAPQDPLVPPPSGAPRRRLVGVAVLLALVVAWMALPPRDGVSPKARNTCIAVVPALEPEGQIAILAIEPTSERREGVHLAYRTDLDDSAVSEIECLFGDPEGTGDRGLIGVRTEEGLLPLARLFALKRFWLSDRAALTEGLARVSLAEELHPSRLARIVSWLVAGLIAAGLAALVLRFSRRRRPN